MSAKTKMLELLVLTCRGVRRGKNLDLVPEAAKWERELERQLEEARREEQEEDATEEDCERHAIVRTA